MKKIRSLTFLSLLIFLSTPVFAGNDCGTENAHVTRIYPWESGVTFIELDKPNNCGCKESNRFGFTRDDQFAKTYLAQALTAFATNSNITIYGKAGCKVHDDSPFVYTVIISK